MAVHICVCNHITFAQALDTARQHECSTVGALMDYCELGSGCGFCIPYMQLALQTGQTDLPVLNDARRRELREGAQTD